MALFTLGCRNGLSLCVGTALGELATDLIIKWLGSQSRSRNEIDKTTGAATYCLIGLFIYECGPKTPSEVREEMAKGVSASFKRLFPAQHSTFDRQRASDLYTHS